MIYKEITINAWKPPIEVLHVIQEEADGRELIVYVTGSNNQPIDLTGKTVSVYMQKPDNTIIYNACTVSGNAVTVVLTGQMMAVAGCSKLFELQIVDSDSHTLKVTLPPLHILPSNYDGAIESTDEFTALTQALSQIGQATEEAGNATEAANTAAESANTAASSANDAAESATTAAGNATTAAGNATAAAESANAATSAANVAKDAANTAASNANAATSAANTAAGNANTAANAANEAAEEASTTAATTATNVINQQKAQPNGLASLNASGKLVQMPTASDVGAVASADLEKRLWSSSSGWNSGSITVPGFSNYHLFAIQVGSAIRCLGVRYNTGSLQFSGIVTSANYAVSYSGSFLIDGDSLTWNGCRSLSHYPDSYSGGNGHSNVVDQSITAIYGIL